MGIRERAIADWARYSGDTTTGHAVPVDLVTPDGLLTITIAGLTSIHHMQFNGDGRPVNVKNAALSFSESALYDNYPVRNDKGEVYMKGHLVKFKDSTGTERTLVVKENHPNQTIGAIVLILGEYKAV